MDLPGSSLLVPTQAGTLASPSLMNRPIIHFCQDRIVPVCAGITFLIGAAVFTGWVFHVPVLKDFGSDGITMKANTSLCLLSLGAALFCVGQTESNRRWAWSGYVLATLAGMIGLTTLAQYVTGADLGIDQLFFSEAPGSPATSNPGRMGLPACISFSLGGLALASLGVQRGLLTQICGVAIAMITAVSIIGYSYGIRPLYGISMYTGIAVHTACALTVFAVGLVAVRPAAGFMTVLCADSAGGIMARRLLLPALLLPFTIGWIRTIGEKAGWIDPALGRPVMVVLLTGTLIALICLNARAMTLLERRRLADARERARELARIAAGLREAKQDADLAREEAEKASRAKSDFLATLSHELRTPLSPALLTLSSLEQHPALPPELRHDVALVRKNLLLETKLISDLLDLTRIERQKLVLELSDVDIHEVLREVVQMCANADAAPISFDFRAVRHGVKGDDTRVRQIFWNLVNNAQKFTPPDGRILVATDNPLPGQIRIRVIDTGAGINPATFPRLFGAFEQGESLDRRQRMGLGLGLSITRKLVDAHGGSITGTSAGEGHGSTFTVELPAIATQAVPPQKNGLIKPRTAPKLRVLLVEDHAPTLVVLKKVLTNLGHTVFTASTVADAVILGATGSHDVLISDLGLPDGTGVDLMNTLGRHFRGRAIALSGYGAEADIQSSKAAGFSIHLTKPVEVPAILAALQSIVDQTGNRFRLPLADTASAAPLYFPPETGLTANLTVAIVPSARNGTHEARN